MSETWKVEDQKKDDWQTTWTLNVKHGSTVARRWAITIKCEWDLQVRSLSEPQLIWWLYLALKQRQRIANICKSSKCRQSHKKSKCEPGCTLKQSGNRLEKQQELARLRLPSLEHLETSATSHDNTAPLADAKSLIDNDKQWVLFSVLSGDSTRCRVASTNKVNLSSPIVKYWPWFATTKVAF